MVDRTDVDAAIRRLRPDPIIRHRVSSGFSPRMSTPFSKEKLTKKPLQEKIIPSKSERRAYGKQILQGIRMVGREYMRLSRIYRSRPLRL